MSDFAYIAFNPDGTTTSYHGPQPNVSGIALTDPKYIAYSASQAAAALINYAKQKQAAVLLAGQTFNVASSGATAIDVLCDGTNDTRADLALLALYGQANPTGTKTWIDNNGVETDLTGAQLVTLSTLAGNWISDTYPVLARLIASIESGSVTTYAEVDGLAWPTS